MLFTHNIKNKKIRQFDKNLVWNISNQAKRQLLCCLYFWKMWLNEKAGIKVLREMRIVMAVKHRGLDKTMWIHYLYTSGVYRCTLKNVKAHMMLSTSLEQPGFTGKYLKSVFSKGFAVFISFWCVFDNSCIWGRETLIWITVHSTINLILAKCSPVNQVIIGD